jgi:hypothetical protein
MIWKNMKASSYEILFKHFLRDRKTIKNFSQDSVCPESETDHLLASL